MYILQCTNADVSVMTTVFNAGYSIHHFNAIGAAHHVHGIAQQFNAFKMSHQSPETIRLGCAFFEARNSSAAAEKLCASVLEET